MATGTVKHYEDDLARVFVGPRAFLQFRRSSIRDCMDLAKELAPKIELANKGDQDAQRKIVAELDIRLENAADAVALLLLLELAVRCFAGWSDEFIADGFVASFIARSNEDRTPREIIKQILICPGVASAIARSIEFPFTVNVIPPQRPETNKVN